ncbi:hypothetical protein AB0G54_24070 [Streptomyces yokosukanensis]|uniref:hypothetical protein n=1 Tax=Streptomyces yokosukanensis TaxID=67386 RepID=UPI000B043A2F|nr:hypothetical protein [Streptomyces yokosukanensis]
MSADEDDEVGSIHGPSPLLGGLDNGDTASLRNDRGRIIDAGLVCRDHGGRPQH